MRSVLGHIAAQGVNRYLKGPHTEAIRDYILDPSLSLPMGLSIHYWVYPSRTQVLMRDAGFMDMSDSPPFAFWLLKFYPVAFMVVLDANPQLAFPTGNFEAWTDLPFEARTDAMLRLRPIPPLEWPEAPTKGAAIMFGQDAISATEVKPAAKIQTPLVNLVRRWQPLAEGLDEPIDPAPQKRDLF